jgi:pSer/pThr/pTyr-binding forkhead associated (FHA) protein
MRLVFPNGEHASIELREGASTLGSGPKCDVVLVSPGIALTHCEISVSGSTGRIFLTNPSNPVTVSGTKVVGQADFKGGDSLSFGEIKARVVAIDRAPSGPQVQVQVKRDSDDDGRTKVRQALPKYMLRGVSGVTFGKVFPLHGTSVIGRQDGTDIQIISDEISRRHAELRPTPDGVVVEDLGSANGTYINDRRITRETLRPGDELRFDTIRFQLVAPGREAAAPVASAPQPPAMFTTPSAAPQVKSGGIPGLVWVAIAVAVLALGALGLKLSGVF